MITVPKKVLVVEDSLIQSQVLQKLLEEQGLRVLCAPDGRVGVELAQQWLPDVVVLDLRMPDMDGFEVCQYLRENPRTNHIPIVMMTQHPDMASRRMGIYLGVVDFIPKDELSNIVLLETLRQLRILGGTGQELLHTEFPDEATEQSL